MKSGGLLQHAGENFAPRAEKADGESLIEFCNSPPV
jgi:hypothetical protein